MDNTKIADLLRQVADLLEDKKPQPETKPTTKPKTKAKTPKTDTKTKAEPEPQQDNTQPQEPTLSLEQVRSRLAEFAKAGKSGAVKAALCSLGVQRLSDLEPARYGDLLEAVADA